MSRFEFDVDPAMSRWNRCFGVNPDTCVVFIDDEELIARFGPWTVRTPVANIIAATITGPYRVWRVAGPARLSIKDRGLTFATSHREGLCLQFRTPVDGIDPFGLIHHPSLTVTVTDAALLTKAIGLSDLTSHDAATETRAPENAGDRSTSGHGQRATGRVPNGCSPSSEIAVGDQPAGRR